MFGLWARVRRLEERVTALEAYTDVAGLEEQRRKVTNGLRSLRRLIQEQTDALGAPETPDRAGGVDLDPLGTADELAAARRRYGMG